MSWSGSTRPGPAENVLPGAGETSILLAVDDATSVGITGVRGYPDGFAFEIWLFRADRPSGRRDWVAPPQPVRLGVRSSDGRAGETVVPVVARPAPASRSAVPEEGALLVLPKSAFLGPGPMRQEVWVSPLPSAGPVEIAITGLEGQPLTRAELSGEEIRRAAARAIEVWPAEPPAGPAFDAVHAPPLPPPGAPPSDADESLQEIRAAFRQAFTGTSRDPLAAVQDGVVLRGAVEQAGHAWPEVAVTIQVGLGEVAFLDDVRAAVQYQLSWSGAGEFGPQLGYAVRERGKWKVARDTYCRLLDLPGVQYPPAPPVA